MWINLSAGRAYLEPSFPLSRFVGDKDSVPIYFAVGSVNNYSEVCNLKACFQIPYLSLYLNQKIITIWIGI